MLMKPPSPPALSAKRRMKKNHRPKKTSAGSTHDIRSRSQVLSTTREYSTLYLASRSASAGSTRVATMTVLPPSGVLSLPVIVLSPTTTSETRPAASAFSNSLYGTGSTVRACHSVCSVNSANSASSQ